MQYQGACGEVSEVQLTARMCVSRVLGCGFGCDCTSLHCVDSDFRALLYTARLLR